MKKIVVWASIFVFLFNSNVSLGKEVILHAESEKELIHAEKILAGVSIEEKNKINSVTEAVRVLKSRGYEVSAEYAALMTEIEKYKKSKPKDDAKAVVKYFNKKAGLKEKAVSFEFTTKVHAISYYEWTKLTTTEKLLIASNPVAAVMTDTLKNAAFRYTQEKFGFNGLGDSSDGYRHAMWNALMTRDISRSWAQAYATAHEDRSTSELTKLQSDGFSGYAHKAMDLSNNSVGRALIAWHEFWFNCSDATVKQRVASKLTNTSGNITWLHK